MLWIIDPSAFCQVWQVKLYQPNLRHLSEEAVGTLCRGPKCDLKRIDLNVVGSVVERLERHDCNRHGLGSKPTRCNLLYSWERHFMALFPAL